MKQYNHFWNEYLRKAIKEYRVRKGLSQEQMAEALQVSPRAYFDQEHGKYGFSALTFARFLVLLPDEEALALVQEYRRILEREESNMKDE